MAIIKNVEVFWVKCNKERPDRYQDKGPAKWTIQIRVYDKKTKDNYEKEYGFKFSPVETDDGKLAYKAILSRYAFKADAHGNEDLNNPNDPVNVVLGDLSPVDPDTVGNGSVCNVSFFVKADKTSRTLKGIQVMKYKVFEPRREDDFELSEDFEIIRPTEANDMDDEIQF